MEIYITVGRKRFLRDLARCFEKSRLLFSRSQNQLPRRDDLSDQDFATCHITCILMYTANMYTVHSNLLSTRVLSKYLCAEYCAPSNYSVSFLPYQTVERGTRCQCWRIRSMLAGSESEFELGRLRMRTN